MGPRGSGGEAGRTVVVVRQKDGDQLVTSYHMRHTHRRVRYKRGSCMHGDVFKWYFMEREILTKELC